MPQEGNETRGENLGKVSIDLLSLPPLINRLIRKKLIMTTILEEDVDLKLPHFEIMRVLAKEGTMHPAKIGDKLLIGKAHMTQLIDKLVEFGYVSREMDSVDRRTFNITITEKAQKLLNEQDNMVICAVTDVMSSLSEEELESLSYNLRTLRDMLFNLQ